MTDLIFTESTTGGHLYHTTSSQIRRLVDTAARCRRFIEKYQGDTTLPQDARIRKLAEYAAYCHAIEMVANVNDITRDEMISESLHCMY